MRGKTCLLIAIIGVGIVPPIFFSIFMSTRTQTQTGASFGPSTIVDNHNSNNNNNNTTVPLPPIISTDSPHTRVFQFLQNLLRDDTTTTTITSIPSDIVELRHCNLKHVNWDDYVTWASFILEKKMKHVRLDRAYANFTEWQAMEQEFALELLEIYATHLGYCDYDDEATGWLVVPPVPLLSHAADIFSTIAAHHPSATTTSSAQNDEYARLAICIIAFQDAPQLQRLVEAIHMPHHYILIHLERRTPPKFQKEVQEIASHYKNVAVVQFGTIIYRTDMVSIIQLQLMKWFLTKSLTYDYHVTLNGASFPLYSAKELARHLQQRQPSGGGGGDGRRKVWMGELVHGPMRTRMRKSKSHLLTGAKRLIYTRGNTTKSTFRIASSLIWHDGGDRGLLVRNTTTLVVSPLLQESMSWKTVSGNQAVYSHDIVQKLLASPHVMKLFALAKYGCCGVLEEHTWIAAMQLIGVGDEALENGAVWQVWGGQAMCGKGSVHNAILTQNSSLCFQVDDGTIAVEVRRRRRKQEDDGSSLYIHGNEMMDYLKDAKRRGFLFARKFQSNNGESMALLDAIQRELHDTTMQ